MIHGLTAMATAYRAFGAVWIRRVNWVSVSQIYKNPIYGALTLSAVSHPSVNTWATEKPEDEISYQLRTLAILRTTTRMLF